MVSKSLSKREIEVVRLIKKGMQSGEIAYKLGIETSTVMVFRRRLYKKIGVHNIVQLIDWLLSNDGQQ